MGEDKQDGYVSRNPLQVVAIVISQPVGLCVVSTRLSDPNPHDRVEYDGAKDERPLNYGQHWQRVDIKNVVLKRCGPGDQAGVHDQVDAHVGTDRNQTA